MRFLANITDNTADDANIKRLIPILFASPVAGDAYPLTGVSGSVPLFAESDGSTGM